MPGIAGTWAERLAWAVARLGHSRADNAGRDWTPSAVIDDCALFASALVFGNDSRATWNVDGFKTMPGGAYHVGKAGLRAADVVLFDWDGNGVGNHVEVVTSAPNALGIFQTIGANGSDTIAVAWRLRSGYVLGYWRPAWPAAAPAPTDPTPAPAAEPEPEAKEEPRMDIGLRVRSRKTQTRYVIGEITSQSFDRDASAVPYSRATGVAFTPMNSSDIKILLKHCEQRAAAVSKTLAKAVAAVGAKESDGPDVTDDGPDTQQ